MAQNNDNRTIRVNVDNGELAEEWERDPRVDMEAVFEREDIEDSDDATTVYEDSDNGTELLLASPETLVFYEDNLFINLRGSYSTPPPSPHINRHRPVREWTQSPITPPPRRRINFFVDDTLLVPSFDSNGSLLFYEECERSEVLQKRDPDFKRKYEENGGSEHYFPSQKKMKEDRDFYRECADDLIQPYSDNEDDEC